MESGLAVTTEWVRERMKSAEPLFFVELRHAGDLDLTVKKVRGALRVTTDDAQQHLSEIPKERVVVVCSSAPNDEPAYQLARLLLERGYRAHALSGGLKAYLGAGLPVEDVGPGRDMTRSRGF